MSLMGHQGVRPVRVLTARTAVSNLGVSETKGSSQSSRSRTHAGSSEAANKTGVKRTSRHLSEAGVARKPAVRRRRQVHRIPVKDEINAGTRAQSGQLTILERRSVSCEVESQYIVYYQRFKDFCKESGVSWPPPLEDCDALLADHLDVLFMDGKSASEGEKAVAAVEFSHVGVKNKVPRSRRALKGWRKEVPPGSRLPLPRLAMYGIAMLILQKGRRLMALKVVADFDMYLRPGESMDLRAHNIVAPVRSAGPQYRWYSVIIRDAQDGRPDKVGVYDNSLQLNNPETSWIGPLLLARAKALKCKSDLLFNFTMEDFRKSFVEAAEKLGLGKLHPYQLRHGGAAEDLNSGFRDHAAVKARGRWKTDQSVRRYAKVDKVQELLNKMSPVQLAFCKMAQQKLRKVFNGGPMPASL